jgi:hypothetical protein
VPEKICTGNHLCSPLFRNWFAKRGLSWHIGVAFRRRETIESLAFIHIFSGQISQDSNATSAVILDIVEELKERNDSVGKVHLWSENQKMTNEYTFLY